MVGLTCPDLSDEQQRKLMTDLGVGKTVLGYSMKLINNKLAALTKKYGQ